MISGHTATPLREDLGPTSNGPVGSLRGKEGTPPLPKAADGLRPPLLSRRPLLKNLPTGTVTFLFTDIEGSTRLLQQLKEAYADVLVECRRLICISVQERCGQEVDTEGDAIFAAFSSARDSGVGG